VIKLHKHKEFDITFNSISENEGFARMVVTAFMTCLDPTLEELADVKTAVSEAVTNAIIHGYNGKDDGKVNIKCEIERNILHIKVSDNGVGIDNIEKAMEPLYTSKPEMERGGMGFAFMEAFMEDLEVISSPGKGTIIKMTKTINSSNDS
jgi:stage II sporulation protein AB (anti-sigma F factor)